MNEADLDAMQPVASPIRRPRMAAESALREFIDIARDAGIGVGIVAFPDIAPAKSPGDFPLAYLMDRLMDVCAAERIACVDMRRELLNVSGPEGWWANRLDPHPGPRANDMAAKAVAAEFMERWRAEHRPLRLAGRSVPRGTEQ